MQLFKGDEVLKKDKESEKETIYIYDQVKRDEKDHEGYCQKCKRESVWCKDRKCRDYPKQKQNAPLATSQVYGWRVPIDDLRTGFSREAVCKRTFFDPGHI